MRYTMKNVNDLKSKVTPLWIFCFGYVIMNKTTKE